MANLSAIPPRFKAGFSGNVAGGAKCAIYGLHRRLRIGGASISLAGSKKMEIKYTRENGWEIWSTSSNYFLDFWSKAKTPGKSGMITGSTFTSHISRVDGVTLAGLETKTSWRPHLIRPPAAPTDTPSDSTPPARLRVGGSCATLHTRTSQPPSTASTPSSPSVSQIRARMTEGYTLCREREGKGRAEALSSIGLASFILGSDYRIRCADSSADQDQESDLQPEGRASGFVQTSGLEDSCWYALDRSLDLFDRVDDGRMQCVQHFALIDDRRGASIGHGFFVLAWTACGQANDGDERIVDFDQCCRGYTTQIGR